MSVDARHVGAPRLHRDRDQFVELERAARERWLAMTATHRAAVFLLVREQLMAMLVDPESWLPTSIEPGSPAWIDVHLMFELKDIDETEAEAMLEMERRRETRRGALAEMERTLRANQPGG